MTHHINFETHPRFVNYAEELGPRIAVCLRVDSLKEPEVWVEERNTLAFGVAEFHLGRLISEYSSPTSPYLLVYEEAHAKIGREEANPNSHYHLFMEINCTVAALRAAIKRTWTGNAGYSLKQAKPELIAEHFNYLCKGAGTGTDDGPQVVDRSDCISDEDIVALHGLFWKNNDAIQVQKTKRHAKVAVSEQIYQLCLAANTGGNKRKIAEVVVDFYAGVAKRYRNPVYCRTLVYQTACWLEPQGHDASTFMDYVTSNPCL